MALEHDDIADLVTSTLQDLGRMKFTEIAMELQDYPVMSRMLKKERVQFDSGKGIRRTIMHKHSDAAANVALYATDTVDVKDVLTTLSIPWRNTTTNYSYDLHELSMNRGASRILDLLMVRRKDAMLGLAEHMEEDFWSKPGDSTDKVKPFGIDYWLVRSATTGFSGGNPSGFSDGAGGIDSSVYTRWKNWAATYTTVSKTDLIKLLRRAHREIKFKSPVSIPDYRKGKGERYRLCTNRTVIEGLEEVGEAQNENLGRDLAPMDGVMSFKRSPIDWVPQLDSDSADPIYLINYDTLCPVFLKDWYLKESKPKISATQHLVLTGHIDLSYNYLCVNRRRNAVLATSA